MGIKDEFHQTAILSCIDELLNKQQDCNKTNEKDSADCSNKFAHNLTQHSFNTLERCGKCNKYLRGLLHQGFICQDCGLVAHRMCAATGLPACTPLDDRPKMPHVRSPFGRGLCLQVYTGDTQTQRTGLDR